jgi:type I restriction enzyme S subunit
VCSGTPTVVGLPSILAVDACIHDGMLGLVHLSPSVEPEYLFYRLTDLQEQLHAAATHGGTFVNLTTKGFGAFTIAIPPPPEQSAIVTALSDVDELLSGLDRLIAKKRDLKQAAMQQLLTAKKRLPGFSGEWEVKTFGDIVEKIVGGGTPSRANPAFWGNEISWVTVKDFATFDPRRSQESITSLGLRNSASHLIPAGTLITSTRMALGKAVVYEVDVAINQDLKALSLKRDTSVAFLTYYFEHFGGLIDELGSGSTVKGISLAELRRFPFYAPPLAEQTAIAEVLTEMDAELTALEQRREKTRALKQGMMQELLTGRIRLVG